MHKVVAPVIEMRYIDFNGTGGFMSDIEAGDYVECTESSDNLFTKGKRYKVLYVLNGEFLIEDNIGDHSGIYMPFDGFFWSFKKAES